MNLTKRLLSFVLAVLMLFSMSTVAFAATEFERKPIKALDYKAHDALANRKQMTTRSFQSGTQLLGNDYIEFFVNDIYSSENESGRFTIGNREGNPNYTSDNYSILMFGHDDPWSSYTTIRINNTSYIFNADEVSYDSETLTSVSTMTVENVLVTQTLQIVKNEGTGLNDTVRINYTAKNLSSSDKNIGIRIMLDTMLGNNDGAPFKVPSVGNITYEREMRGNQVPQYWQAFDSLENASVFAVGTFYKNNERKPDKVQFADWGDIYSSTNSWNYEVNSDKSVTGDSAVAAYWNPVKVSPNGTTEVSTYYGVGYALNGTDFDAAVQVPVDGFAVQITDENGAPLSGVSVTAQNLSTPATVVTDNDGMATFTALPSGSDYERDVTLKISKAEHQTITVNRRVSKGGLTTATIYKDDGKARVFSALATLDNTCFDLLNQYKYFKENVDKTTAADDDSNVKWLNIDVDASSGTNITKYQILQGGKVVVESSESTIKIPVFTGTPGDTDKYGTELRIDKLEAGKTAYIRVVDRNGNASEQKKLGFKISKPTTYGMEDTEGSLDFGKALTINVPSNIPILGDTEIELGWNGLPFKFEISDDGKVKFAINPEIDLETGEVDWGDAKKDFDDKQLQAINNRLDAKKAFGGKLQKFGAGNVDVNMNIMGYGEGYADENNNFTINVGLVITIQEEASYTWTFFLGYVPVYVAVGEKVDLKGTGEINILSSEGGVSVSGTNLEINPSLTINVDGGVGANGVLNVGASGRAKLAWLRRFSDNYDNVSLTGSVYIVAQAFLFKAEKKMAEGTWTIYDSYNRSLSPNTMLNDDADFYSASSYVPIDRSYLKAAASAGLSPKKVRSNSSQGVSSLCLLEYVYPDAAPVLVNAGDKAYLFWLNDNPLREDYDRTALTYSISEDLSNWSEPKQIFEETGSSTADFAFDVFVDGSDIHIALSKSNKRFDNDSATIEDIAKTSEIYYAKLNTTDNSVTTKRLTTDESADTMPSVAVLNGTVNVLYAKNNMSDGLFGSGSTHSLVLENVATGAKTAIPVNGFIANASLGVLNNKIVPAYIVDADKNYDTEADKELRIYTNGAEKLIAKTATGVATPVFTTLGNNSVLIWYADGTLKYTSDAQTVSDVFETVPSNLSRNFSAVSGNNGTKLVWTAMSEEEESDTTAVYATSYVNGKWSPEYKLFDTESELTAKLSGFSSDENTYITHIETSGIDYDDLYSSLYISSIKPAVNVGLADVSFEASEVGAGRTLPLTLTIENAGTEVVDTIPVEVYERYASDSQEFIIENADLGCGETKTYTLDSFVLPDDLDEPTVFYVSLDCEDDTDYYNDEFTFEAGYVDLEVETSNVIVDNADCTNIIIRNLTNMPTSATLRVFADEMNGAVVYEKKIENLTKDSAQTILVDLSNLGASSIDKYYVKVVADSEELLLADNESLVYMALGKEKTYSFRTDTDGLGTVTGASDGQYTPGVELQLEALEDARTRFVKWSSDDITIQNPTSKTLKFTMPEKDVSVFAEFEDLSVYSRINSDDYGNIAFGSTRQLTAVFDGAEGLESTALWSSSNTNVVTVDSNGLLRAVGLGDAIITLNSTDERVVPSTYAVSVVPRQISINKTSATIGTGETLQLSVTSDISAEDRNSLYWESSDTSVATVDENGLVTGVSRGECYIYLRSNNDAIGTTSCAVDVSYLLRTEDFNLLESAHDYENHSSDMWIYTVPGASSVTLTFDERCEFENGYDVLYIYDGEDNLVESYTGTNLSNAVVKVTGSVVKLHLKTDGSTRYWGFKVVNAEAEFPHPHKYTETVIKEATCTEKGVTKFTCSCGYSYEESNIPALGHNYSKEFTVDKTPTVTEKGSKSKHCTRCNAKTEVTEIVAMPVVTYKPDNKGMVISWSKVEGAKSYTVYKKTYDAKTKKWSDWSAVKSGVTTTQYTDSKVNLGQFYKYTVKAVNGSIKTAHQNLKGVKFVVTPTVSVSNSSAGIKVSWKPVTNATGYIVYSSTYNTKTKKWSSWKNRGTAKSNKTYWVDKAAKSGVKYRYTVKAKCGSAVSTHNKNGVSILFIAMPKAKIVNAASGIKVTWNKVSGAKNYIIYRSEVVKGKWSGWKVMTTTQKTANSWVDKTAKSGTTYKYTVRAVNGKVKSAFVASNVTKFLSAPKVTVAKNKALINVTWSKTAGAASYIVYRSEYNAKTKKWSGWKKVATKAKNVTKWSDGSTKKGVYYKYTVRAINGNYKGSFVASGKIKR
ncbi:MAG: Ig-like domain-containing protein [Clostridia bacterium]|nr:Ig-like domain-containing protein [Clostridia bacterium]